MPIFFYIGVVVFFSVTWVLEYFYGRAKNCNAYNLNEFLSNISMGLTSTVVSVCVTIVSVPLYKTIYQINFLGLSIKSVLLQFLIGLVVYDFLYYWNHRWHHEVGFLWLGHSVHHSGQTFNYSTSLRLGILASLTSWVMFMPMALIGVPVEMYLAIYSIQLFYQHLIHTRFIPKLGIAEKVFYTPSHHRVHHARNPQYIDKNHGCFFIIFDKMFGTYAEEKSHHDPVYGTTLTVSTHLPSYINFFELKRAAAYIARRANKLSATLRVLFGTPDYEALIDDNKKRLIPLASYSPNLSLISVVRFVLGLVISIYLAIIFMRSLPGIKVFEIFLLVFLVIGVVDIAAIELNKPKWIMVNWYALLVVFAALSSGFSGALGYPAVFMVVAYAGFQMVYDQ